MNTGALIRLLSDIPSTEWVGLRIVSRELTNLKAVNDALDTVSTTNDRGVFVEVISKGRSAYWSTPDCSVAGVGAAIESAFKLCEVTPNPSSEGSPLKPRVRALTGEAVFGHDATGAAGEASIVELSEKVLSIASDLYEREHAVHSYCMGKSEVRTTTFLCSAGSEVTQRSVLSGATASVTVERDGIVQSRSNGGNLARSRALSLEKSLAEIDSVVLEKVYQEACQLAAAPQCPTDILDLLLMPSQMILQVHESIGHPLEVDRILGDERNFAGSSFVQPEDFGTLVYGSPLLNAVIDPTVPNEVASMIADDSGDSSKKEYLIKDGVLQKGIGSERSRSRASIPCAVSSRTPTWSRAPIDRMGNINLEPGADSLDSLISRTERGVLMDSYRSWSIDDYRRKFQFGCEYGRMIVNGELTEVVRNPGYRGTSVPFWKSLIGVGDASTQETLGTFFCGKGEPNQTIHVGHQVPAALFSAIEVFGGA